MFPISEIEWGPIDAKEDDEYFYQKFIEPEEFRALLDRRIVSIIAEKGAGKSAFIKGFLHYHGSEFSSVKEVDLNEIEFSPIIHAVAQLATLSQIQNLTFMTNLWKCVLIIEGAKKVIMDKSSITSKNWNVCRNYLRRKGLIEPGLVANLLMMASRAWEMVDLVTQGNHQELAGRSWDIMPSSLHPQIIEALRDYPFFDPEFSKF